MKVSDLIKELSKCDPDKRVLRKNEGGQGNREGFEEIEGVRTQLVFSIDSVTEAVIVF